MDDIAPRVSKSDAADRGNAEIVHSIARATRAPLVALDGELRIVGANAAFAKLFSTAKRSLLGRKLDDRWAGHWNEPDLLKRIAAVRTEKASMRNVECTFDTGTGDRRLHRLNARPARTSDAADDAILLTVEDITDERRAADRLRFANAVLTAQMEGSPDGILVVDENAQIVSYNRRFLEVANVPPDLVATKVDDSVLKYVTAQAKDSEAFLARVRYLYDHPDETAHEEVEMADGRIIDRHTSSLRDETGKYLGRVWFFRDVTKQRWEEAAIRDALGRAQIHSRVIDTVSRSDAVISGEVELLARQVTELASAAAVCERVNVWLFNDDESELTCIDGYEATPGTHSSGTVLHESQYRSEFQALKAAPYVDANDPLTDPRTAGYVEGYIKPLGITSMLDTVILASGKNMGLLCFEHVGKPHHWQKDEIEFAGRLADKIGLVLISRKRRHAEEKVRASADALAEAQAIAHVGSWSLDCETNAIEWSDEVYRIFGVDPATFAPSYGAFFSRIHPDDRAKAETAYRESVAKKKAYEIDHRIILDDGTVKYVQERGHSIFGGDGKPIWSIGTMQDITERKRADAALLKMNRTLQVLSAGNAAVAQATEERALLDEMCRVTVEVGEYRLAWIGFAQHDAAKTVRPVAIAGGGAEDMKRLECSWADDGENSSVPGMVIRTGTPQVSQNLAADPQVTSARRRLLAEFGFASAIALPLKVRTGTIGAMMIYSAEPDAFDTDETELLIELADNLSYGIAALRDRAESEVAAERLQRSMETTIEVVAGTVEQRDPYTAGHQRRVAMLAEAMARRMDLSENRIHGLRLAGIVHDLGKIYVPAEILSKPSRLTPVEYDLIKTHAQVGYDILKNVDFPWPIAQVVLQHHERIDGTGYPNGLKGDEILLEARILAVADVVESMMSHRPYRPSRGIDLALAEIESGRGTAYDAAAVDACLTLFRQDEFAFD